MIDILLDNYVITEYAREYVANCIDRFCAKIEFDDYEEYIHFQGNELIHNCKVYRRNSSEFKIFCEKLLILDFFESLDNIPKFQKRDNFKFFRNSTILFNFLDEALKIRTYNFNDFFFLYKNEKIYFNENFC
jgi:hypothetical protein